MALANIRVRYVDHPDGLYEVTLLENGKAIYTRHQNWRPTTSHPVFISWLYEQAAEEIWSRECA